MTTTQTEPQRQVLRWANECSAEELVGMCWLAESKRDERGDELTDALLRGYREIARKRGFEVLA